MFLYYSGDGKHTINVMIREDISFLLVQTNTTRDYVSDYLIFDVPSGCDKNE